VNTKLQNKFQVIVGRFCHTGYPAVLPWYGYHTKSRYRSDRTCTKTITRL